MLLVKASNRLSHIQGKDYLLMRRMAKSYHRNYLGVGNFGSSLPHLHLKWNFLWKYADMDDL